MTKIIFRYTFIFNIGQNLEQDKILELFKSTVSIFVPCTVYNPITCTSYDQLCWKHKKLIY